MFSLKTLYYGLILSGISVLLIHYKRLDKRLWLFVILLSCAFIAEKVHTLFYTPVTARPAHDLATYIFHIYQPIEYLLLAFYYYWSFTERVHRITVIAGSIVFFLLFGIFFVADTTNFFIHTRKDLVMESVCITVYSVMFIVEHFRNETPVRISVYPHFWIVLGNLLFYFPCLFYYFFQEYILHDPVFYSRITFIPQLLNLLLYFLYLIGFLCLSKRTR